MRRPQSDASEEPRFCIKDKRAIHRDAYSFKSEGTDATSVKKYLAIPFCERFEPDRVLCSNLRSLQQKVFLELLVLPEVMNDPPNGCGWKKLLESGKLPVGKPVLEDVTWTEGKDWYAVSLRWEELGQSGHETGNIFNMTSQLQQPGKGQKNPPATPDGFRVDMKQPFVFVMQMKKGTGVDGTFAISRVWADESGKWGLAGVIRSLRAYKPSSFTSPLAGYYGASEEDASQVFTNYDFNY